MASELPVPGSAGGDLQAASAHHRAGRRAEAEGICRRVLERQPRHAGALQLLGLMAQGQGRLEVALKLMRMAVAAEPGVADYCNSLGTVLADLKRFDEAIDALARAVRLRPGYAEAHRNWGIALARAGRLAEAVGPLREAAQLRPEDVRVWEDLVSLHHQLGDLPAMIECRRRIVTLRPDDPAALGELLVLLHYSPDYSPGQLLEAHREWSRRFEAPSRVSSGSTTLGATETRAGTARREGDRDADLHRRTKQPLRVGYVSGDFREHPAARFVLPVLRAHDRERVRVVCYSDVGRPLACGVTSGADRQTEKFRETADLWRDSAAWSDERLAAAVRADGIDVLVDLAGHLDSRRLTAFALRPAPVQVGYFGYPGSTGTSCIEYRVTDEWQDPFGYPQDGRLVAHASPPVSSDIKPQPGRPCHEERHEEPTGAGDMPSAESCYSEKLIRIPGGCWCYDAGDEGSRPVAALPALSHGYVTYAVFNRLIKVTPRMAGLWGAVLGRVPGSRLAVIGSPGEGGERAAADLLSRYGIDAGRVIVLPRRSRREYMALYDGVDIALDTFPYPGMTTICDAMWMGVPTVTLAGRTHVSRTGVSLLSAVGLPELIAGTAEEYVTVAIALAGDLPRLAELRAGLRQRVGRSALADGAGRAAAIEAGCRAVWLARKDVRSR